MASFTLATCSVFIWHLAFFLSMKRTSSAASFEEVGLPAQDSAIWKHEKILVHAVPGKLRLRNSSQSEFDISRGVFGYESFAAVNDQGVGEHKSGKDLETVDQHRSRSGRTERREHVPAAPLQQAPLRCLRGGSGLPAGGQVVQCVYAENWDTNGVLYFLGRMAANAAASAGQIPPEQQSEWLNPGSPAVLPPVTRKFSMLTAMGSAMAGFVRVHCGEEGYMGYDSERFDITLPKELVIDRKEIPGAAFFGDGWFTLELGPNFQLRPTHYTLRNGGGTFVACMTGWVFEGSQGLEGPWHTLDYRGSSEDKVPMEEYQCTAFNDLAKQHPDNEWPHDSVTFPIEEGEQVRVGDQLLPTPGHNNCGFRVFRLRQLASRMPDSTSMYIQGLELYGDLYIPPM